MRSNALIATAAALTLVLPGVASAASLKAITGARYSFSASAGPASAARGSGDLRKAGDFLAVVRGKRAARTFFSRVTLWRIDRRTPTDAPRMPKTMLVLTIRVTSSVGGCRAGTRGRATLVDWNRKLGNGKTSDRVTIRFPLGSCRSLAGSWSNAGGDQVRVAVTVGSRGSARPINARLREAETSIRCSAQSRTEGRIGVEDT